MSPCWHDHIGFRKETLWIMKFHMSWWLLLLLMEQSNQIQIVYCLKYASHKYEELTCANFNEIMMLKIIFYFFYFSKYIWRWKPSRNQVIFNHKVDKRTGICGHMLTHWGQVTYICVSKVTIVGSDNGLWPGRRQAIIWINAGILLIGSLGTNFSEILFEINTFSFKKIHIRTVNSSGLMIPYGNIVQYQHWLR